MTNWTDVFGRSSIARAVFTVRPNFEATVRALLQQHSLPAIATQGMYEPIVEGVAFKDGGWHRIDSYGYGMSTLHTGQRIIGWQSLRLLCQKLSVRSPARRLSGEPEVAKQSELSARFASTKVNDQEGQLRAELIAGVTTGVDMRRACIRLIGEHALMESDRVEYGSW